MKITPQTILIIVALAILGLILFFQVTRSQTRTEIVQRTEGVDGTPPLGWWESFWLGVNAAFSPKF